MSEAPGPITFTMFLTAFGETLNGMGPEDVTHKAFACFDEEASGFTHELLTTMGDCFTDEELDEMYREAPIVKKGNFNYVEFTASSNTVPRTKTTRPPKAPMSRPLSQSPALHTHNLHLLMLREPIQGSLPLRD
ncbi:Myosin regulatory light polypeptide 9 [Myotis davidii]|uniref:Myosin regulatory light polypeptide 9 n=1 Tax=Myotis davidii TaxID=225400 RepID=L5LUM9_MYODS|nr:Myosin regulatory light polypeptide 9 [Myotis davidii]